MPEWDGLLPPVSCGEHPIIDGVRTPVAYSSWIPLLIENMPSPTRDFVILPEIFQTLLLVRGVLGE